MVGIAALIVAKLCYRSVVAQDKNQKWQKQSAKLVNKYGAKHISLITDDGVLLSTVLIERENAEHIFILCHGYRENKEKMRRFVKLFDRDTIVLFDFRAHGASGGEFTTFGYHEKYDIKAIVDFLRTYKSTECLPLVGLGRSMGGATLLAAAAGGLKFDALIIDSSFANLHKQVEHVFTHKTGLPKIPFMFFTPHWFEYLSGSSIADINPEEYSRTITCPVLVIHSPHDTFTPVEHGRKIYQNLASSRHIWLVDNAKHAQSGKKYPRIYKKKVEEFLMLYGI